MLTITSIVGGVLAVVKVLNLGIWKVVVTLPVFAPAMFWLYIFLFTASESVVKGVRRLTVDDQ